MVWWRENDLNLRKNINLYIKPTSGNTYPCVLHTKWRKHYVHWETYLLALTNDLLLIFNILIVFNASSCIFVQRKKYLRWRAIKIFFQNGSETRKSQVDWPLNFCLKEQYAALFCRTRFKYGVRSLNTQHFHSHWSSKNVLFVLKWLWPLNNWPESLFESSCWDIVPIRICCTVRETE